LRRPQIVKNGPLRDTVVTSIIAVTEWPTVKAHLNITLNEKGAIAHSVFERKWEPVRVKKTVKEKALWTTFAYVIVGAGSAGRCSPTGSARCRAPSS